MHMPAELAVWTTGHDLKALSALWNYVGAGTGLNLPGTVVLAGWPAFPWGQIGKGPMPPKLMVLVEGGVGVEMLELYIDKLLVLDHCHPKAKVGGSLRPLMHAVVASMIMHYADRFEAGEMQMVLIKMRAAFIVFNAPDEDVHGRIKAWGKLINARFISDNLHLTSRDLHTGQQQVVAAMQETGATLGQLTSMVSNLTATVGQLQAKINSMSTSMPKSPKSMPNSEEQEEEEQQEQQEQEEQQPTTPFQQQPTPVRATPGSSWGSLQPDRGEGEDMMTTTGTSCVDYYLKYCKRGGHPKMKTTQMDSVGKVVVLWFGAMTTPEEKLVLKGPDRDEEKVRHTTIPQKQSSGS